MSTQQQQIAESFYATWCGDCRIAQEDGQPACKRHYDKVHTDNE